MENSTIMNPKIFYATNYEKLTICQCQVNGINLLNENKILMYNEETREFEEYKAGTANKFFLVRDKTTESDFLNYFTKEDIKDALLLYHTQTGELINLFNEDRKLLSKHVRRIDNGFGSFTTCIARVVEALNSANNVYGQIKALVEGALETKKQDKNNGDTGWVY